MRGIAMAVHERLTHECARKRCRNRREVMRRVAVVHVRAGVRATDQVAEIEVALSPNDVGTARPLPHPLVLRAEQLPRATTLPDNIRDLACRRARRPTSHATEA